MRNRVTGWLRKLNARYLAVGGLLLISTFIVYFWHLASLTPGLSPAESAARSSSKSIHAILLNPVNAPQRGLQLLAQKAGYHHAFSMRLASVIVALILVGCLFWLMKVWYGLLMGSYGVLIFATMPITVLLARSATPDILLLSPAAVLAAYTWLLRQQHKPSLPWLALVLAFGLSLYVPGMPWLLLVGLVAVRKQLVLIAKTVNRRVVALSLLLLILLLSPIVYALIKSPDIYHSFLLVPRHWESIVASLKSIIWAALALVWRTRHENPFIIGRLPLLNIVQVALSVFGAYVMWTRAKRQMFALLAPIAIAVILSGLNNNLLLLGLAVPSIALLATAGLRYLYVEWRSIFPKNPLPLSFAVILISSLVGLQIAYGLRYSLVAWPHTAATKQLYVLK